MACRTLAQRIADLEGVSLGTGVGYRVRDDALATAETRIVLATPGIALRSRGELAGFETVILDEFHERGLEVDLLLGLLPRQYAGRLIVMSATLQDERVAQHLGGQVLRADGRTHPVQVRYLPAESLLPDDGALTERVIRALGAAKADPGDVLVFLPGKGEIADCVRALERRPDLGVQPLHGELSLDQQRRVFGPSSRRKVILATNVAETSVTVPGVGVVIDTGLVRKTRYFRGRGHLALSPIAQDSADQRSGRAGRTGPGVVYRLWSSAARLAEVTAPEIFRESLVPLVLGAAAWGETVEQLPLLDPPKAQALASARETLRGLGALDASDAVTAHGHDLFGLPLDPWLGTLLQKAKAHGCLADAVDLAAALSVGRPLFTPGAGAPEAENALLADGCDAVALIRAVREGEPTRHDLVPAVLAEARRVSVRLRRAQGLPELGGPGTVQRARLAQAAMAADPQSAHGARRRGGHAVWSAGGNEVELARESAVHRLKGVEAIVVLATRALSRGHGENTILVTCAMPAPIPWLTEAGLGTPRLESFSVEKGVVVAKVERLYAQRVLSVTEEVPRGALAREAVAALFLRGSLFKGVLAVTRDRLALLGLWSRLQAAGIALELYGSAEPPEQVPTLEEWVRERVELLGVESGEDLAMLSREDFTPADVPEEVRAQLEKHFPASVRVGAVTFDAEYAPAAGQVVLRPSRGGKVDWPPDAFFPRFGGLRVVVEVGGTRKVIRGR